MPWAKRIKITISRAKLEKGYFTPDQEEILEIVETTEEARQERLETAAAFLYEVITSQQAKNS